MNLTVTCKCGKEFRVELEREDQEVRCPECGQSVASSAMDEEITLQEVTVIRDAPPPFEEDDGTGYGLAAADVGTNLYAGRSMFSTLANVPVDEVARCIAFGCDGAWALAGQGSDVLIVDMQRHRKLGFFQEHEVTVTSVALSATELLALSADDNGEIRLWDLATGQRLKKLRAHKDAINTVALSPDARFAVTGGVDGRVKLWELATGARRELEQADWSGEDEEITYVTFARDGQHILAGGNGGSVGMWNVATGRRFGSYTGVELPISCVRLSDEGGIVTAATEPIAYQGASYVLVSNWIAGMNKVEREIHISVPSIRCCITPDRNGQRLILGGGDKAPWLNVVSLQAGRCQYGYEHLRGTPICLAVSPRNNRVLAAMTTSCLQVFGMETV